jgi:hypothetical protein
VATLEIEGDELVVHVSGWQRVWAFHGDVRVPLSAVQAVDVPDNVWLALRGWRSTGVAFPGKTALGKRRHGDGWDFTAVSGTHDGAVRVSLNGGEFEQLLVSVPDAQAVAHTVAAAAGIAR